MPLTFLVSNDDGVYSEGLRELRAVLDGLGEVYTVAPDRDQSAMSHALSLNRPLRIEQVAERVWSVDGTPTDCINLAVNGFLKDKRFDLLVSGINIGENLCEDITYSGTVSAAIEGTLLGIPSIALSLASKTNLQLATAAHYALKIVKKSLRLTFPSGVFLNINIPNLPLGEVKGIKVTKQGKRIYGEEVVEKTDPRGKRYYWIGGNNLGYVEIPDSDIVAVKDGWVSVTPIKLDLTCYECMEQLAATLEKLRNENL